MNQQCTSRKDHVQDNPSPSSGSQGRVARILRILQASKSLRDPVLPGQNLLTKECQWAGMFREHGLSDEVKNVTPGSWPSLISGSAIPFRPVVAKESPIWRWDGRQQQ